MKHISGKEFDLIIVCDGQVPAFFNSQFPLSYPIIAPMYSDVDIRRSGVIYYRETKAQELLDRANQEIVRHFSRGFQFRAQSLFIATWDEVGRYDQKADKVCLKTLFIDSKIK